MQTIAFLGLGLMGQPMAQRLLAKGASLRLWNRSPDKVAAFGNRGAWLATTPMEAVQAADIVISMLADGSAVDVVMQQSIAHLPEGACWIDMSSTRQDQAQQFARQLARHGVGFVDAPVSGGVIGAEAGTLAIMAGCSVGDYARVEPILATLGRPTRVGEVGCGQLAKLCNQLIVGATLSVVAEALLLAKAGGADPAAVRTAIRGGFAESRILEVHGQRMLERNFTPGGKIKTQSKDMDNILLAAQAAGVHLPVTELVAGQYHTLMSIAPDLDQAAALLGVERHNPNWQL